MFTCTSITHHFTVALQSMSQAYKTGENEHISSKNLKIRITHNETITLIPFYIASLNIFKIINIFEEIIFESNIVKLFPLVMMMDIYINRLLYYIFFFYKMLKILYFTKR